MPAAETKLPSAPATASPMREALLGRNGALLALADKDADIARAMDRYGVPNDRSMPADFTTLARIITGQQISRLAASAVWKSIEAAGFNTPDRAAKAKLSQLRAAGLSVKKAEYIQNLARALTNGALDLARLGDMPGEEAQATLTALPGIGAWTADNYRIFALHDMDAWPYNDLALQGGMQIVKGLEARPDGKTMQDMGDAWRPWRGAGALMLWHVYAGHRKAQTASPAAI